MDTKFTPDNKKSCLNCQGGSEFFPGNPIYAECDMDPGEIISDPEKVAKECQYYEPNNK